jgi:hypothetical protein
MNVNGTMTAADTAEEQLQKAGAKIEPQDVNEILHGTAFTDRESMFQYFPLVDIRKRKRSYLSTLDPRHYYSISPDPVD